MTAREIFVWGAITQRVWGTEEVQGRSSGGSRISVRGMRRGSGPIFWKDDPNFLRQIVSAHRRSQDFQRVGAPRGGSRISGWGTMAGPKAPNEVR